jgi:hypothetical protein
MTRFLRSGGLVLLTVVTVVLCYLALTRDMSVDTADDPAGASVIEPSPTATVDPNTPPEVEDQVRADFSQSRDLPEGARTYDNQAAGSPLEVRQGFLTHDPGTKPVSIGSLEVQLPTPVQKIGATVVFPLDNGGSVNLVAWTSSLVDAKAAGQPVPTSGLRLTMSSSLWQLTIFDKGETVIAGDEFEPVPGPQTFEVYRSEDKAYVVDPRGTVTVAQDPQIAELAGPWACWQVAEDDPSETPARVQAIWAG